VERKVPAIVGVGLWERAQLGLHRNQLFARRHARHEYLLRGLMKCKLCSLTYTGVQPVYRCMGYQRARGPYGVLGQRCPSVHINAQRAEDAVMEMLETILKRPGDLIKQLQAKMGADHTSSNSPERKLHLEMELERKQQAKVRLALREAEGLLDRQTLADGLARLEQETTALRSELAEITANRANVAAQRERLASASALLKQLRAHLDQPLTFAIRRRLLELLVEKIEVETIGHSKGHKSAKLYARLRFIVNAKGTG
jgi:site-specific DNA recombinase